jgi:hypothetical protein
VPRERAGPGFVGEREGGPRAGSRIDYRTVPSLASTLSRRARLPGDGAVAAAAASPAAAMRSRTCAPATY